MLFLVHCWLVAVFWHFFLALHACIFASPRLIRSVLGISTKSNEVISRVIDGDFLFESLVIFLSRAPYVRVIFLSVHSDVKVNSKKTIQEYGVERFRSIYFCNAERRLCDPGSKAGYIHKVSAFF